MEHPGGDVKERFQNLVLNAQSQRKVWIGGTDLWVIGKVKGENEIKLGGGREWEWRGLSHQYFEELRFKAERRARAGLLVC